MVSESFSLEKQPSQAIATLTLTRPQDGNRLMDPDIADLADAIRAIGEDRTIKLALLRAQGEHFCLGRKPPVVQPATPPDAFAHRDRVSATIMSAYAALREVPVPVIGLVQGDATGFGCALATMCDITIASSRATFCLPELDHNFPPTLAMSALLHRVPPKTIAMMVYMRTVLSAAEAAQVGLVSEVVEPEALDAAAERVIAKLAGRSRLALGTIKEYLSAAMSLDTTTAGKLAENMISVALASKA